MLEEYCSHNNYITLIHQHGREFQIYKGFEFDGLASTLHASNESSANTTATMNLADHVTS